MVHLNEALVVTVIGMGIVFAVLIILWGTLELFKVIFAKQSNKNIVVENKEDEGELIAILMAAVAANLNTSTYNLNIKSYRRVNNKAPVWNAISRKENLEVRL